MLELPYSHEPRLDCGASRFVRHLTAVSDWCDDGSLALRTGVLWLRKDERIAKNEGAKMAPSLSEHRNVFGRC